MSNTGVALLGFGQWGRNLARNFSRLGALRIVSDPDPRALANLELQRLVDRRQKT